MSQRHPIQNDEVMMVTTNTLDRVPVFADPTKAREAIECLYRVQTQHPFFLYGFVIMPDHCHFLLKIISPNTISKTMSVYKSGMTFDTGIPKLWQPRFDIRIVEGTVGKALEYIHTNPVRQGLSENRESYPWSSASGEWDVTPLGVG